uniref:EF-hand domain-containing protein n=1 Tax=Ditylenchus dipsaci TaxID=166011 RepID=A0A915ELY1_9BILA
MVHTHSQLTHCQSQPPKIHFQQLRVFTREWFASCGGPHAEDEEDITEAGMPEALTMDLVVRDRWKMLRLRKCRRPEMDFDLCHRLPYHSMTPAIEQCSSKQEPVPKTTPWSQLPQRSLAAGQPAITTATDAFRNSQQASGSCDTAGPTSNCSSFGGVFAGNNTLRAFGAVNSSADSSKMHRQFTSSSSNGEEEFSMEELQEFGQAFKMFDKDGNGTMNIKELGIAMRTLGLNPTEEELLNIVNEYDVDGNGKIDFGEFCKMLKEMNKETDQELIRLAFKVFDKDGNGYITTEEFKHFMTTMGEKFSEEEVDEIIKNLTRTAMNR